ncbi:hypothetical protein Tco_0056670 [Tanacetum coccineum]
MLSVKNVKAKYKEELEALEAIIDRGDGNEEIVNKRTEVVNNIQKFDKIHSSEMAQKAKVKWSIEGDKNTSFFHGVLNKKRSILNIRGIMVDGNWIESPKAVKGEFFQHFSSRFDKPDASPATINMRYPKTLTYDQQNELESEVSNVEIKRAVYGIAEPINPPARMDSLLASIVDSGRLLASNVEIIENVFHSFNSKNSECEHGKRF